MQSYGEFQQIPRKTIKSSSTCMDKRLDFGQIGENTSKFVQKSGNNWLFHFYSLSLRQN